MNGVLTLKIKDTQNKTLFFFKDTMIFYNHVNPSYRCVTLNHVFKMFFILSFLRSNMLIAVK